ncbi:BA75_01060T0 [Komagataella pastoris]|uniref:Ribosome assembly protein 1 n=1 Tax=Komagataella pastoris TaxID=4922 RepID=A0A1B2J5F9_PICPA|nr:BA75_01060T0 [Komagataella pastoris]
MRLTKEQLNTLQNDPSCVRNICIVAHVDHGKTSLSDSLLATNGIISQKMAGKIRYLDSREDEQLRGITMESSAVSLYFRVKHRNEGDSDSTITTNEHLINLIDSPGHVDFSSEVSTASRLCDGAVVLVDVVEGVCSQTISVLRQVWSDKLKAILVLNKIDRLITELKLSPQEAYTHLSKVIEQVNSVIGSFFTGERMQQDFLWREKITKSSGELFTEKDDKDIYFAPETNNVVFASAVDGWGFSISQIAGYFGRKLGMKREKLQKVLWGDFCLDPKSKKITTQKNKQEKHLKPIFVSLVLDNIWSVYKHCLETRDQEKLGKIVKALGVKVVPREIKAKDSRALLRTIFSQWLPVSSAVLLTVIQKVPSPLEAQKKRMPSLLSTTPHSELIDVALSNDIISCNREGLVCAYVSKMLSIPTAELGRNQVVQLSEEEQQIRGRQARAKALKMAERARLLEVAANGREMSYSTSSMSEVEVADIADDDGNLAWDSEEESAEEKIVDLPKEELLGFARVYSGTLKVGQTLVVLGPKYSPKYPSLHVSEIHISDLYLIMGRDFVAIDEAPAGNIVAIGGLMGKVLKSGTVVTLNVAGVNLAGFSSSALPIVRVAVEPVNPVHMHYLEKGLEMLNQADPCVRTYLQDTGEHILATAGELHLERCLKDLKERFAGIEIQVSEPAIPYRETILNTNHMNLPKNGTLGRGSRVLRLSRFEITLTVKPLPVQVTQFLISNINSISKIMNQRTDFFIDGEANDMIDVQINQHPVLSTKSFKNHLAKLLQELGNKSIQTNDSSDLVDRVVCFGPKGRGPNIFMDNTNGCLKSMFKISQGNYFEFQESLLNGFQLATFEGPLAAEPVQGIVVFLDEIRYLDTAKEVPNLTGRLLTSTRDYIHEGFLDWSPRIMLAMYSCEIQASVEVLGKVYAVVQQRRGRIVSEEMKEGTSFFTIKAQVPLVEAFGFSEDMRKKTSGAASPQLVFSGFEIIDIDPFWVPTTEEELEELGEFSNKENIARKYMNDIRRKKGLFVDEKVVQKAEKQRNMKKD